MAAVGFAGRWWFYSGSALGSHAVANHAKEMGNPNYPLTYTSKLWPGLTLFLDDPRVPLDNNATERAIRGLAVGRKNHYGSKSQRGTGVAALYYSLVESAKLAGIDPANHLEEAARRAIANPGTVTLPHDLISN